MAEHSQVQSSRTSAYSRTRRLVPQYQAPRTSAQVRLHRIPSYQATRTGTPTKLRRSLSVLSPDSWYNAPGQASISNGTSERQSRYKASGQAQNLEHPAFSVTKPPRQTSWYQAPGQARPSPESLVYQAPRKST